MEVEEQFGNFVCYIHRNKQNFMLSGKRIKLPQKSDQRLKKKIKQKLTIETWKHANVENCHEKGQVEVNFPPQL